jgi:hypothetical protein
MRCYFDFADERTLLERDYNNVSMKKYICQWLNPLKGI